MVKNHISPLKNRDLKIRYWIPSIKFFQEISSIRIIKFAIPILLFLALTTIVVPTKAQENEPAWKTNLRCNPLEQKFQGVTYCTESIINDNGDQNLVHVIVVDLKSPGVHIEYIIPEGIDKDDILGECKDVNRSTKYLGGPGCDDPKDLSLYPVMSLQEAVERIQSESLAVVINGDYSACTISSQFCGDGYREHGPEGLTVVRGTRLDGSLTGDGDNNIVRRPWLAISQNPPLKADIHQSNSDNGSIPFDWIYTGIGGGPWLIQNGEIAEEAIRTCQGVGGGSCRDKVSQTAVGITKDKRWLFFTIGIELENLRSLAVFMDLKLDVWEAIKFDGSGSSQLYYSGKIQSYLEIGDERQLTNFLAIEALPLEDKLNIGEKLEAWWHQTQIYQKWEEIVQLWDETQQTYKDIQQLWTNMQDSEWWALQVENWLLQCCSALILPTGAIGLLWVKKVKQE